MTEIYVTRNGIINRIDAPEAGCWINCTAPTDEELAFISAKYKVDADSLRAATDIDERSRIESDENYTMLIVNMPAVEEQYKNELYTTLPLAIIMANGAMITVCSAATPLLRQFAEGKVRDFNTHMKSRFVLQVLFKNASLFLQYLHLIDKKSDEAENKLHKSTKNSELIELLKLEKSLVYFTTALKSNEVVLEKLLKLDAIKKYPDDAELLEDTIVENKQAIEMANIYSGILSGMMDAFASVISNNLNIVMKVLAIITIVMSIPTMIFSAYGMNMNVAGMPLAGSPWGFAVVVIGSVILAVAATLLFVKMKTFK